MCDSCTPCHDCPWQLLILRGKPVVLVLCEMCKRWFVSKSVREFGDEEDITMLDVTLDGSSNFVNSLLRCDCMAPYLLLARLNACSRCSGMRDIGLQANPANFFDVWLEKIVALPAERGLTSYEFSSLPAYTLQRRCGADPRIQEHYLKLRPDARDKVEAYQERRRDEQRKFKEQNIAVSTPKRKQAHG